MRDGIRSVVLWLALALGACSMQETAGPPFAQAAAGLPPIPPGETRIFFYRWLQPYEILSPTTVYLNGRAVGVSWIGTTFYRDVPAGSYLVSVFSPGFYPNQFKTVATTPGQTVYVRIQSMLAWSQLICGAREGACQTDTFVVAIENPETAPQEMQSLPLIRG